MRFGSLLVLALLLASPSLRADPLAALAEKWRWRVFDQECGLCEGTNSKVVQAVPIGFRAPYEIGEILSRETGSNGPFTLEPLR